MSISRDVILQQALALSAEDRAFVVAAIENSLAETNLLPDEVREKGSHAISGDNLASELERRSAGYRAGSILARSAEDVLAEMLLRERSK